MKLKYTIICLALCLGLVVGKPKRRPQGTIAGVCPKPKGAGICVQSCNVNSDCSARNQLCCSNGCGHVCMDPVRPVFTPRPSPCLNNTCAAGEKCIPEPKQCVRAPCPQYRCEDSCTLPKETGPCKASFQKWYFDTTAKTCKKFRYGGCGGNGNRFNSLRACNKRCSPQGSPPQVAKCPNGKPLKVSGQEVFCGRGPSRQDCPATHTCNIDPADRFAVCCPKPKPDTCSLPKVTGPCRAHFRKWYYDTKAKACKPFTYGGCEGNENRFNSLRACNRKCSSQAKPKGQRQRQKQRRQQRRQ